MTELTMSVPAPTVDLAQCRACNGMTEPTLDRVDALTSLLEASNDLWYIVGIYVPQTELTVLIVFTNGIDVALQADKEAEVVVIRMLMKNQEDLQLLERSDDYIGNRS